MLQLFVWFFIPTLVCGEILTKYNQCSDWSRTHLELLQDDNSLDSIIKFDKPTDLLDMTCNFNYIGKIRYLKFYSTSTNFILGNEFYKYNLFNSFKYSANLYILIYNTKGFNLNPTYSPIGKLKTDFDMTEFWSASFVFYVNETTLLTKEMCTQKNFESTRLQNIFGFSYSISFYNRISYSRRVCPFVFFHSVQYKISFNEITNSLIYKNQLEFLDVDFIEDDQKSSALITVELGIAYEEITHRLLNKHLFKFINGLYVTGMIYDIQIDLFASFFKIRLIYLRLDDFGVFFGNGLKWLNSLNKDVFIDLTSNIKEINKFRAVTLIFSDFTFVFKNVYTYPDEDICLFKDFPHEQMVFPIIHSGNELKCTCTILWLIQYARFYMLPDYSANNYYLYADVNDGNKFNAQQCLGHPNMTQQIEQCDFASKFSKCKVAKLKPKKDGFVVRFVLFNYKWLQYVIEVYLQTILCILGILTNTLTILVISNRSSNYYIKNFNNIMYKHMRANSVLNLLYCILKTFSLINICVFPKSSFCSTILENESSQYWKIYGIYFMGNTLRLCINISYLGFSASRFSISTSSKSNCLKRLANIKLFYLLVFLFSAIASLFIVFQYKINKFYYAGEADFPLDIYGVYYCENSTLKTKNFVFKCKLFTVFNLINNVLNNIVIFLISLLIDIFLIRFAKQILNKKRDLFPPNDIEITKAMNLKEKVVRLTIVNSVVYFLSHVPDFVITLLILVFRQKFKQVCFNLISCLEIIEIAQAFNFCSISLQFFVFLKFDRFFKQSILDLCRRSFHIKTQI